jgi:N-acetylated-alpha-linked acidic dipeptidase
MRRLTALGAVALLCTGCSAPDQPVPLGFTRASAREQHALERRLIDRADPSRTREVHRELTRTPHPAGSRRGRELVDWIAKQYSAAGLEDVQITTHEVLLPRPLEVSVGMTRPRPWQADMREPAADGTFPAGSADLLPYHAFSASGEVDAPAVYAGPGTPADYEWLARNGVNVKGRVVIVHSSGAYRYRGLAAFTAEQAGAAAILMFTIADAAAERPASPPAEADTSRGIPRGSILYDFFYPGDPETPGWPSLPGARRIARADAAPLPRIVSAPLSAADARSILATLEGPAAPSWWGPAAASARVGPGATSLRVRVRLDDGVRPVWTVTGMLRGSEEPESVVVVGNHHDAWLFGGVDPSTGTAAMLELVRVLGTLRRDGWSPRRSILFASWDAEEFGLTSSTEWGEQHAPVLRDRAVAYLNVDSAASGPRFAAAASPSLMRVIAGAAAAVSDPRTNVSVLSTERGRTAGERGTASSGSDGDIVEDRLGGGSDYSVFLNHLGVPSADLAFDGPYPTYHTAFDTHAYVERVADPGFAYSTALARLTGVAALRLAAAEVIPIDPAAIASSVRSYLREVAVRVRGASGEKSLRSIEAALDELARAAQAFESARTAALEAGDPARYADLNRRLRQLERAFVDDHGLPGREWYRHVLMAPARSYQPSVLPGLSEALDSEDSARFSAQAERLTAALRRAAVALGSR